MGQLYLIQSFEQNIFPSSLPIGTYKCKPFMDYVATHDQNKISNNQTKLFINRFCF